MLQYLETKSFMKWPQASQIIFHLTGRAKPCRDALITLYNVLYKVAGLLDGDAGVSSKLTFGVSGLSPPLVSPNLRMSLLAREPREETKMNLS